jgi:polygalacturonase
MQFTTSIFNRSVTVEMMNHDIYEMKETVNVFIDGTKVLTTNKNVFSLMNLLPDHEYTVKVASDTESAEQQIRTSKESVLFDVREFGAKGDGASNDTPFIQAAILACPENGTVYLPKGTYFVTPLFLKSRMTLWLDEGAELLGSTDRRDYPILPGMTKSTDEKTEYSLSSWEGNPLTSFASLITAISCSHVDIIGPGTINGNADHADWWENHRSKRIAWRPNTVFFNGCDICACRMCRSRTVHAGPFIHTIVMT